MKKFLILILTIVLLFSFCACGDNDDNENNGKENNSSAASSSNNDETESESSEDEKDDSENADAEQEDKGITMDDVLNHPVTPEEEIEVIDNGDGTCAFAEYIGDDNILVIPETVNGLRVTSIDKKARDYNKTVEGLVLADSIEIIGAEAFNASKLKYLVCGKNLREIGYCAFGFSENLCEVIFNDGLEIIGLGAFLRCNLIKEVTIPESVKIIETFIYEDGSDMGIIETIKGVSGSYAEEFAKANGFEFIPIEK